MNLTKAELFAKFEEIFNYDDHERIIKYLFDYFDSNELNKLYEFIKDEKGIS